MGEPTCRLCEDFGSSAPSPAVWMATVPMCGERPRYPLCEKHLNDIAAACEDVELIEEVHTDG